MSLAEAAAAPAFPSARRAWFGRWVGVVVFHTLYRGVAYEGRRVPAEGALVLVANHSGFLDGPVVFSMSPRPTHFLVKKQYFDGSFGWILRGVGQIPIDRTTGDRAALDAARGVLSRGGVVGVFPEGTRGRGDVQQVNQGATWLAMQTGARIVPVACFGTRVPGKSTSALPRARSRVVVVFGEAFALTPDPSLPGRARLRAATEQLRRQLASHVEQASHQLGMPLPDDDSDDGSEDPLD